MKINGYNYRLAIDDDKDQVLKLLNGVFEEQQRSDTKRDSEFWNWKYKKSPFGESLITVVEKENDIICVGNLWPWEFLWRGKILRALQPCDSAVHPEFRGKGLFSKSRINGVQIARERGIDFFFNFPNQNSLPAYLSLGWYFMGKIQWQVKILKPINLLRGKLKNSKSEPVTIPKELRIDVDVLDSIATRRISFDAIIKINRKEGFHQWRYDEHPSRTYGMITNNDNSKSTLAAVFTINQKGLIREMVIVDLIGSSDKTVSLFKEIVRIAKTLNIDFIAVIDNKYFSTNELWKIGFINKKLKNMVVLPLSIGLENELTDFKKWDMVGSIHDSI